MLLKNSMSTLDVTLPAVLNTAPFPALNRGQSVLLIEALSGVLVINGGTLTFQDRDGSYGGIHSLSAVLQSIVASEQRLAQGRFVLGP